MLENMYKIYEEALAELTAPTAEFAVVEKEIRGVRYPVFKNYCISLRELYLRCLEEFEEQPCLVYEDYRWSYGQIGEKVALFCQVLLEQFSIQKGDRVAIAMRNYPEWIVSFMAITSIGAVAVPMNAWWTSSELEYGLEDSGSLLVIADHDRLERLKSLVIQKNIRVIAVRSEIRLPGHVWQYEHLVAGYSEDSRTIDTTTSCESAGEVTPFPEIPIAPDEDAILMYTSGSTGYPKGVISTHQAVVLTLTAWKVFSQAKAIQDGVNLINNETSSYAPAALMTTPLFHVSACHGQFLLAFYFGAKIVMMHKWDAEKAMELIQKERITFFNGVPTMSWEMLRSPNLQKYDLSSLSTIIGSGAARPPAHVKQFEEKIPGHLAGTAWGLTETNGLGSTNHGLNYVGKPDSVGRLHPLGAIKIVDENNREVAVGESGEILFKSPTNARGYWKQAEATARAFHDGWFRTGDVGYLDEEGFIYIVDRIKDIIIRGGENISCQEVEAAIYEHESVLETAVFGIPDERLGEVVYAVVFLNPGEPADGATLKVFLRERLAHFKIPEYFEFHIERLPRTGTQKIHKLKLRKEVLVKRKNQNFASIRGSR